MRLQLSTPWATPHAAEQQPCEDAAGMLGGAPITAGGWGGVWGVLQDVFPSETSASEFDVLETAYEDSMRDSPAACGVDVIHAQHTPQCRTSQRIYIPEEQAVMQELGMRSLTNITSRRKGTSTRWRVQFPHCGTWGPPYLAGTWLRGLRTCCCCGVGLCAEGFGNHASGS